MELELARLFWDRGPKSSTNGNGSGPIGRPVLARAQGCQEGVQDSCSLVCLLLSEYTCLEAISEDVADTEAGT